MVPGLLGYIAPDVRHPDTRLLDDALRNVDEQFLEPAKLPEFFTMLPEMSGYRRLVEGLGPKDAQKALQAIHDMVVAEVVT